MVSGWDKSPGPDNDYASGGSGSGLLGTVIFALALVAMAGLLSIAFASDANAVSSDSPVPSSDALARCTVRSAAKIAKQRGDALVLARTLPLLCNREIAALERAYIGQFGIERGQRIFRHARFEETVVELGTATIAKARMR